jgi:hypothetical protein
MNKTFKVFSLLAVLTIMFAAVSPALAQEVTPPAGSGPFSDYMVSAFAASVGLSVEEVQARRANGETLAQIAQSLGYDKSLMTTVGSNAMTQAVSAGAITQERADQIANRRAASGGMKNSAMLEKLGLTKEQLNALLDSGMSMQDIFAQQGVEFPTKKGNGILDNSVEICGLTREEIKARRAAGEKLRDICPALNLPEKPKGEKTPPAPGN